MQETIEFLNDLADASGKVIRHYFRQKLTIESKQPHDPVTAADKATEEELRRLIAARYPDDSIQGEEYGKTEGASNRTWVIDPIDGTRAFAVGRATFTTLVALCVDGVPVAGVLDQPIMGDRWVGAAGMTTFNNHPCRTRACPDAAGAGLILTAPGQFRGEGEEAAHRRVVDACAFATYGGDCYGYGLLASGFADAVLESSLKAHDIMALVPIVEGAGGVITDWEGQVPTLQNCTGRAVAAGDPALHQRLLELICA